MWENHRIWNNLGSERPSEVFARSFYGSFVSDAIGISLREHIGVERIFWESDYPHGESSWPNSQELLRKSLEGVPKAEVDLITVGNARRVFRWPDSPVAAPSAT